MICLLKICVKLQMQRTYLSSKATFFSP